MLLITVVDVEAIDKRKSNSRYVKLMPIIDTLPNYDINVYHCDKVQSKVIIDSLTMQQKATVAVAISHPLLLFQMLSAGVGTN